MIDQDGIMAQIAEAINAEGVVAEVVQRGFGSSPQIIVDGFNCMTVDEIRVGLGLRNKDTGKAEVRVGWKVDDTDFERTRVFKEGSKPLDYGKIAKAAIEYVAARKQADARNEEMRIIRDVGRTAADRLKAQHPWAISGINSSLDKIDLHFRQLTEEQADAILKAAGSALAK